MPKTRTEINLRLFDDTALEDALYQSSNKQPFVDLNELKEDFDEPSNYATLEENQWNLDGSKLIFLDDMSVLEFGYWSLSQSNASKTINADLTVIFDTTHSTIGVTIFFYGEDFATKLNMKWYDGANNLLANRDFANNRPVFFADEAVVNYRKIVMTFAETNKPRHFIKIKELQYGTNIFFRDGDIKKCDIIEEVHTFSDEISINKMSCNIFIQDKEYIQAIYKVLLDQQKLIVAEYVNDVRKEMGTFYLTTRKNPSENSIIFDTEDFLGIMANETYLGGAINDTVENVLNNIFGTYGTALFTISDDIKNLNINGYIPITDYRRAIQLVAFAVNAVVDCSRSDKINIYRLPTINPQSVDKSEYFKGSSQEELKKVTGVSLELKSYVLGTEVKEVYKVTHGEGTYKALFSEPITNVSISNGTIFDSGVNYAVFGTNGGVVTINGTVYNVSNQTFVVETPNLSKNVTINTEKFENTIIWDGIQNAQYIYGRLIDLNRRKIKLILGNQKVGDFVSVDALYDQKIEGYIESIDVDLSGGFVGNASIVGVIK